MNDALSCFKTIRAKILSSMIGGTLFPVKMGILAVTKNLVFLFLVIPCVLFLYLFLEVVYFKDELVLFFKKLVVRFKYREKGLAHIQYLLLQLDLIDRISRRAKRIKKLFNRYQKCLS